VSSRRRPFVIGVTGDIACGKSTVMGMLADLGAATIDADAVYHELIAPGMPLLAALRGRFGPGVVAADGGLDRRALGAIVFGDAVALADLDRLTHPAVIAEIRRRLAASTAPIVAVDAVKLIESGLAADCDEVWIVTCDPTQQVARLMARNGLTAEAAARRVAALPPLAPKLAAADVVIDNSGDLAATRRQVEAAFDQATAADRAEPDRAEEKSR
jgi:dephospho-CoA kinase